MTDLIASLADAIIGLINAKPASPTKEEVDAVLRLPIETCIDAHKLSSYPIRTPPPRRSPLDAITVEWLMALEQDQRTRAEVDAANERVRVLLGDCQGEAPPMSVLPCPRHLDGIHTFDRPQHAYATPCVCGARKP
jgi:hypothetical protein